MRISNLETGGTNDAAQSGRALGPGGRHVLAPCADSGRCFAAALARCDRALAEGHALARRECAPVQERLPVRGARRGRNDDAAFDADPAGWGDGHETGRIHGQAEMRDKPVARDARAVCSDDGGWNDADACETDVRGKTDACGKTDARGKTDVRGKADARGKTDARGRDNACDEDETGAGDRHACEHGAHGADHPAPQAADPGMIPVPGCNALPPTRTDTAADHGRTLPSTLAPVRQDRVPDAGGVADLAPPQACAPAADAHALADGALSPGRYTVFPNAPGLATGVAIDVAVSRQAASVVFHGVPPELVPRLDAQRPRLRACLSGKLGVPVALEVEQGDERGDEQSDAEPAGGGAGRRGGGAHA